jgi:hypothetical protein
VEAEALKCADAAEGAGMSEKAEEMFHAKVGSRQEYAMGARLVWQGVIDSVHEKELIVSGKIVDGKAQMVMQSQGWYVQIGNMSLFAGVTKPAFEKGDEVRLTLEHFRQEPQRDQEDNNQA